MIPIVGVRFGHDCRISYCDPKDLALDRGMRVVVETPQGEQLGTVIVPTRWWPEDAVAVRLLRVVRVANDQDEERARQANEQASQARAYAQERIAALGLPMRLVDVEWTLDQSKVTFYFVADGRVDFRELVHQLTEYLHCRVELRQIGARDHARILGGLGPCGRPLCCALFLREFAPVSIRMAKDQNLVLNPGRISGMCGRLMCCLRYEEETDQPGDEANGGENGSQTGEAQEKGAAPPDEEPVQELLGKGEEKRGAELNGGGCRREAPCRCPGAMAHLPEAAQDKGKPLPPPRPSGKARTAARTASEGSGTGQEPAGADATAPAGGRSPSSGRPTGHRSRRIGREVAAERPTTRSKSHSRRKGPNVA